MKQLIKKNLTLIIPFLNEKDEVEKTLQSIREHSCKNEIEIILINDASDDGYNYELVSKKYHVNYIVNEKRLGVAASRDLGIALCQTPYFLLLDAHMRFYNNIWVHRIIMELDSDKRTLLCCQTKSLKKDNGLLIEKDNRIKSYGACVELHKGEHWQNLFGFFIALTKMSMKKQYLLSVF
jgi:glycosyltransferase involved in cell wall biosynthesis